MLSLKIKKLSGLFFTYVLLLVLYFFSCNSILRPITVERKMKQLKELSIIQHEGARKTGGYSLNPNITEEAKEWLLK